MHNTDNQSKKPTGDTISPAGHALLRNERGSLFAMRWGQIKLLSDLDEARCFLVQIGGGN